jgi:hypothetical protein
MIDIEHRHGTVLIHLRQGNRIQPLPDLLDGLTAALDYAGDRPVVLLAHGGVLREGGNNTDAAYRARCASALRRAVDAIIGRSHPVIAAFGGKPLDADTALAAVTGLPVSVGLPKRPTPRVNSRTTHSTWRLPDRHDAAG